MDIMKLRTSFWTAALVAFGTIGVLVWQSPLFGAEAPVVIAPPAIDNPKTAGPLQTAVLAGGCFWGVQGVYEHVRGVRKVIAGYAGGDRATAQYETVSSGTTGHAESVKIVFDPAEISYGQILQIAFSVVHDPTQLNRQESDVGSQYRSAVFYADDGQKRIAEAYISQLVSRICTAHRHSCGSPEGVLPGRGLPPGLLDPQPHRALHCLFRYSQDRKFQADFSGAIQRATGFGAQLGNS